MSNIIHLKDIKKEHTSFVGEKAAYLGEIFSNFEVPEGFVIPFRMFEKVLESNDLKKKIESLASSANIDNQGRLQQAAESIQKDIHSANLPEELKQEILNNYNPLFADNMAAVRSSADSNDLNLKGISMLNVFGEENLIKAVKACWASAYSAKAITTRKIKGIPHTKISVIIQKMINPSVSGNILTSSRASNNEIVIEACFGLGESISNNIVVPDRYVVDKTTEEIKSTQLNKQNIELVQDKFQKKTVKKEVSNIKSIEQKLSNNQINLIVDMAKKIEQHFNKPLKIEFGIESDKIFILQSTSLNEHEFPLKKEERAEQKKDEKEKIIVLQSSQQLAENTKKKQREINQLLDVDMALRHPDFEKINEMIFDTGSAVEIIEQEENKENSPKDVIIIEKGLDEVKRNAESALADVENNFGSIILKCDSAIANILDYKYKLLFQSKPSSFKEAIQKINEKEPIELIKEIENIRLLRNNILENYHKPSLEDVKEAVEITQKVTNSFS